MDLSIHLRLENNLGWDWLHVDLNGVVCWLWSRIDSLLGRLLSYKGVLL